jgi:hypothetical protein
MEQGLVKFGVGALLTGESIEVNSHLPASDKPCSPFQSRDNTGGRLIGEDCAVATREAVDSISDIVSDSG